MEPPEPRLTTGELHLYNLEPELAIKELEELLKASQNNPRVLTPLAADYRLAGRDAEALKTDEALIKADPSARSSVCSPTTTRQPADTTAAPTNSRQSLSPSGRNVSRR